MAASLTKEQLRNELISHGVQPPVQSARKEEFVKLYEQHVAPIVSLKGDFSSDEEPEAAEVATNNTSLVCNGLDIASLSDEDLYSQLQQYGIPVGPIVDTTRSVYQRKLVAVMRNGTGPAQTEPEQTNGNGKGNGHHQEDKYSDSEGEPEPELPQMQQHSPQKGKSSPEKAGRSSSVTPAPAPSTSAAAAEPTVEASVQQPAAEPMTSVRKRVTAERPPSSLSALPLVDRQGTPTPRPSIRSVTGSSSGSSQYKFESRRLLDTIDAGSTVQQLPTGGQSTGRSQIPRYLVLLLILLAVAYFTYTYVDLKQVKQMAEGIQQKVQQWGSKAVEEATAAAGNKADQAKPNPAPDV